LRILVISNLFPDTRQPTFGTFIAAHVAALRRAGADVQVAAIRGVRVHESIGPKYLRLALESVGKALAAAFRGRRFRIVEAHIAFPTAVVAWPIARLIGAKLVVYCHGSDLTEVGMRSAHHRRLATFVFRRADLLVANSRHTATLLEENYGIARSAVVVWSPGIEPHFLSPRPEIRRRERSVLYVGRLDRNKGIEVLLEAVAGLAIPPSSLRIVGSGPERDKLEALATRLDVTAEFTGPLSPEHVSDEMATAAVLVVPSTGPEGLGLVALEGMASGALVIATDTGGLTESVVPGRTGWLVERGNSDALRTAIEEALAAGSDADRIRHAARALAEQHDIDRVAAMIVARYGEMVASGGRSSRIPAVAQEDEDR
jgi:glycosyltransferase involved in cell wall biosynthesis